LKANIAQALTDVAAQMVDEDTAFFAALGQAVPDTPLPVPQGWTVGSAPDMLQWPVDQIPVVTVMAYDHRPDPEDAGADQWDVYQMPAYIEAVVSGGMDVALTNRIAWRYGRAIIRAIAMDSTLGGRFIPFQQSPPVTISNASARRVSDLVADWIWVQMVHVDLTPRVNQPSW
jgi:hypothetical protein